MAPVKPVRYEFNPEVLVQIRENLGLTQVRMARELGVPANTLSRWEIGASTPDAQSLAAIYSLSMEHGKPPTLFRRRRPIPKQSKIRSRLLVMWDFQNVGIQVAAAGELNAWIRKELEKRFSETSYRRYKGFSHPTQADAVEMLEQMGWKFWEDDGNLDDEIVKQAKSDCGQDPSDTVLVLITKDGDFNELVKDLRSTGVTVNLMSPEDTNNKLLEAVGTKNCIRMPNINYDQLNNFGFFEPTRTFNLWQG